MTDENQLDYGAYGNGGLMCGECDPSEIYLTPPEWDTPYGHYLLVLTAIFNLDLSTPLDLSPDGELYRRAEQSNV